MTGLPGAGKTSLANIIIRPLNKKFGNTVLFNGDDIRSIFDLTDYSGSAAMSKSVAVGATLGITTSFTVGFTSAYDGQMKLSLGTTSTRNLAEGRYVYDVLVKEEVGGGATTYTLANGNIYVYNPVSSAP